MRIVFHGANAASFSEGFAGLIEGGAEIVVLPDALATKVDRAAYEGADVIVGVRYGADLPRPAGLKLFHVPGAGYDAVDLARVPDTAVVCNCFGHETAIAEYVMAALLMRYIPLSDADRRLRQGEWAYWAGTAERAHDEMAGKTMGLLGYGHTGKAIAARAKAFEMTIHVANRSPVAPSEHVDRAFTLDQLPAFWGSVDVVVVSVPLTDETRGIVDAAAFAAMRPSAVVVNVGRGPTIDETALFEALSTNQIAGAIVDTWYAYPSADRPTAQPSTLPFHELTNVLMTPHMSGWTGGTIGRRQRTIAENVIRRASGRACTNVVREDKSSAT
jgi:phosphoglycerate dehydrogenase-like enzyme